jgi:Ca2+-binding RTX toxin-like protein
VFNKILIDSNPIDATKGIFSSGASLPGGFTYSNSGSIRFKEDAFINSSQIIQNYGYLNNNITGNNGNETIAGGMGDDTINGLDGIDTAVYSGVKANYSITKISNGFAVLDNIGNEGTDALINIERLQFSDQDYNLVANQSPTGTATIKGTLTNGSTLSISNTIKDADGIGKFSYAWQNNSGTLSTKSTYTLANSDIGKKVWAVISYTDKLGNIEEIKSNVIDVTVSTKSSTVNDLLIGTVKADKLNGLAGNDTLIGGLGKDSLTGGVGADVFKFNSVNDSSTLPKQADTITDFKHAQGDKIDLSAMHAFTFIGAAAFGTDATGQLRFDTKTSTLYASTNADAAPELAIVLNGVKTLAADDFIL